VTRPLLRIFYLLYCVEAGIFLLMAPWSVLWVRNSMAQAPVLGEYLMTGQIRGAVSAFGFLLLLTAMLDFVDCCRAAEEP
jgi:hypothetical protein